MCEKARDLMEDCIRFKQAWTDEISDLIPNAAGDVLQDGRESEGISRLDGQEITRIKGVMFALLDLKEGSAVTAVSSFDTKVGKACVRTLRQ